MGLASLLEGWQGQKAVVPLTVEPADQARVFFQKHV